MGGIFSKESVEQRMHAYARRLQRAGRKQRRKRYQKIATERQQVAVESGNLLPDSAQALIRAEEDSSKEDSSDDEEVGFPVHPQVPIRQATFKLLVDLSHLFKEKGGLEYIFWSPRREEIVNLYAFNEWGLIEGWQAYTEGPGIRWPKTFGWCWKLVPVEFSEESNDSSQYYEKNKLLHPGCQESEDPWGEHLVWKFDPRLACDFVASRLPGHIIAQGEDAIETLHKEKLKRHK
ncbi:nef protein [Simian immunodeficiency virus]|uniref:Protein Nef n=1 Tax=Simian immunodeficiency virus TaxID=11723 RepID=B7FCB0_SIV|nr:nef protein [Simian immunodeficiency virus]